MYRASPDRGFSQDRGYRASPDIDDRLELKDSATIYETERIKVLQQERIYVQKKTFTKWCNSYLEKVNMLINDLFVDLCDGKILMKLLVIISGENFGRPNRGVLRVQKMENVSRCLNFLATKVTFENIGAEDIVDGSPTLILGLIWTIILRFQIQDIVIEVNELEHRDKINAKDALLLWCQRKTDGYRGVKIDNFSTSWRNGLGFNALIHAHRPDLINFDALDPADHIGNLNNAFNIAEEKLGIKCLLDAEDVDVQRPDDKSIMTYVASYYHYFAKMKSQMTGSRRIDNVLGGLMEMKRNQDDYETLVSSLLDWIHGKIGLLNDRNFPNSLEGIKKEMNQFTDYRVVEKPPKYRERGNIEVLFFNIQAKLKSGHKKMYIPPEGKLIRDIESAWIQLEKAEHDRELALREELIRQERLKQLAEKFERKAALRESWLNDMTTVLSDQNFGSNTTQVEAALKKHEAIAADIDSRKDRFVALSNMVQELCHENYHGRDVVRKREQQILAKWQHLNDLLEKKRKILNGYSELLGMFREIESIGVELKDMEPVLRSEDNGKHLLGVEDLLQKHNLVEAQLNALGNRIRKLNQRANPYMKSLHPEAQLLQKRLEPLNKDFENVFGLCQMRKAKLEESLMFFQFLQDSEEEEAWLLERTRLAKSQDVGKDLASCMMLTKRHEALEQEMAARVPRLEQVYKVGDQLTASNHYAKRDIKARVESLKDKWMKLRDLVKKRRTLLEDAAESHQYYADANEAESWMREKMPLVMSEDFGKDEPTAKNLLQRHNRLDEEIKSFEQDIKRLDQLATLMTKADSAHNIKPADKSSRLALPSTEDSEEFVEELVDVPYEYEVEEIQEREVMRDELMERAVPQVRASYPYKGNGMEVAKNEVCLLLEKTNPDWWRVQRENGQQGFIPANYVKEIEPKIIQKVVKQPVKSPVKVMVKKTGIRKELVKKGKSTGGANLRRTPSARSQANLHFDKVNVEQRQQSINNAYKKVCQLSQARRKNLEDAILFFKFCRDCDIFESWMNEKEQIMMTKESLSENMEAIKRKYEMLITDMAANSYMIDDINKLAGVMLDAGHPKKDYVKKRQADINDRWRKLNNLKMQKEKSLAGASGIELFQKLCDELKDWIGEKNSAINLDDVGKDLKSVQALKRKHQNLEQELKPLDDKITKMNLIAKDVRKSHPDETPHVNMREKEIMDMWKALQDKAKQHKKLLDEAEDLYKFKEEAKDLENRMAGIKNKLKEKEMPRDLAEADALLKKHQDLKDDIEANRERFNRLNAMAQQILAKDPNNKEVLDKLRQLKAEQDLMDDLWAKKNKELQAAKEHQAFLREANQIESLTGSHNAMLDFDFDDLENMDLDNMDMMLKRHEDMENSLKTQEEKLKALDELADRMLREGHPDALAVDAKRKALREKLNKAKEKLAERKKQLESSQALQEFKRDADELSDWIKTKYQLACDESYRDLTNLLPKLQKHQALEAELKSNKGRLDSINDTGNKMIKDKHYATPEIKQTLNTVNDEWKQLDDKVKDKGMKLRQAAQQELFNKALEDANAKLAEMEKLVSSDDIGKDLRSVKDLLFKHQMLENEMAMNAENLKSIVDQGNKLAKDGHFDSKGILQAVKDFDNRFKALQQPMAKRRQKLEDSLKWHQNNFDVDSELQWINEHKPAVMSTDYGKNLSDAQNLHAKHKKLDVELQGHQPMIDKVLANGTGLVKANHFASPAIKDKNKELTHAWDELLKNSANRKKNLDISLEKQKYLSEVADVQTWIDEKNRLLSTSDHGKDENAADKLLTKHKVLESEVKTYTDTVKNLDKKAKKIQEMLDPQNAKDIATKQANLEKQVNDLAEKCANRRGNLDGSKTFHEFMRESEDLEQWINDQLQTATSEEYGQDFEHLQVILNKFSEFQLGIESGSKRFERVDKLATHLIEDRNPNSPIIHDRQNQLRNAWQNLLEHVEARSQKLNGAGELHRFNRDVEDALTRIQEKYASIPDDLGRDLKAVQSYIKKHDGFENELVALEAQLGILFDDSERLQATYPGGNAEHIANQHALVEENWDILREKADQRKSDLQASMDHYWFLSAVKNLLGWADQVLTEMNNEVTVRDVSTAADKKSSHAAIKAEIDAREDTFNNVIDSGEAMIKAGHFASNDIREKVQDLEDTRNQLHIGWQEKMFRLEQLYDQQLFFRDANQLEVLSNSQEAYLKGTELGMTVSQVEALIKKHDAFENLLVTQDAKLESLKDFGEKLIREKHFDARNIKSVLDAVVKRRMNIKGLSNERRDKLEDSLLYAQFNRDVAEAEGWIEDRLKIAKEESFKNVRDMQEKMKSLKKHQAFEAEIMANADRIKAIKQTGEVLLMKKHEATPEIQQRVNVLIRKWNELLQASNERGKGLEEARDILKFNEEVEKVESWIREKETLVAACDLGRDYEHCLELQKKVNDVEGGITVDEGRVNAINKLADKLISQGRTDTKLILDKKNSLNTKWHNIQGALDAHRRKLAIALEIHAFNRDIDDINDRINEKAAVMSSDDYGKNLASIQALLRKQEDVEKDMTALHQQIQKMDAIFGMLCKKYPDMAAKSEQKLGEVKENWERLEDLTASRKLKLEDAYQLYRFSTDVTEHVDWCNNMITAMNSGELANTVPEAEQQLQGHFERKTEISGRHINYQALIERGENLVKLKHFASDEITRNNDVLTKLWIRLNENWDKRKKKLTEHYDLQVYETYADQADQWLMSKDAFLANDDLGISLSSVDDLIKKHDGFTTTLEAQCEKITTLEQLAHALLAQDHYAADQIKARCDGVVNHMEKVKQQAAARRQKLIDSRNYQQFLLNVHDVTGWIGEKMQIALDESYRDPSNLQSKIQKHQAFEAEVTANRKRVDVVSHEGQGLIDHGHYASQDIQDQIRYLERTWKDLTAATLEKKNRLLEAYEALVFHRQANDIEAWMDEVEGHLSSEDHGKDIISVNNLLKKHQLLEEDISKHQNKLQSLHEMSQDFKKKKHFMADELVDRAQKHYERYSNFIEPCQIRRDNLEDSLLLHTFYRDVEDELSWIREKRPIAAMTDLGNNLTSVQNLQKKHQALENEIIAHEPLIDAVVSMSHHMVAKKHPATKNIEARLDDLLVRLKELKDLSGDRKLKLLDAVESQTFYAESAEADLWMNDRKLYLTSKDFGKDEDSVQALLKKLDSLELDIENFNNNIGELAALSQGLMSRGHFDSRNIQQQQSTTEAKYRELQDLAVARRNRLVEMKRLYEYYREADEVTTWIRERELIAASEDYGTDLEHVQILQQKFNDFIRDLIASEEKITHINTMAGSLVSSGHSDSQVIKKRQDMINRMWAEVKEVAQSRQESLAGAKKVHTFVRDADDTIEWIEEKDVVASSEDYGQDIQTVKALIVKHKGFEGDLAAVGEQVDSITKTAQSLISSFPDAREHIQPKLDELRFAWKSLTDKAQLRLTRLHQAESVQLYFDDYRGLCAWCNEMQARICSDELARDVSGAEALINRHKENRSEIDARLKDFTRFTQKGKALIAEKNFLSAEIQGKIDHLDSQLEILLQTWNKRKILYDQSFDLENFKREMDLLDVWLNIRKPTLEDKSIGDSIDAVEELLQKHDDFEKMVFAQEDRFNNIRRYTLLEQAFTDQKKNEEKYKVEEERRREKERLEEKKKREQERILEERKRQEEQRKMQDLRGRLRDADDPDLQDNRLRTDEVSTLIKRNPSFNEPTTETTNQSADQGGLVTTDAWKDDNARRKVGRTDSQKKEKRQRTLSLKTKKPQLFEYKATGNLPMAEIAGFLERKHEFQKGRTKATIRAWKYYYTVLCGQLLCFFKDDKDFQQQVAAAPPLAIHGATCETAPDYTKKKNVLRLTLTDGTEYLFMAHDQNEMTQWLSKIKFHAGLPPALQLMQYDAENAQHAPSTPPLSAGSEGRGPPSLADSDASDSPKSSQRLPSETGPHDLHDDEIGGYRGQNGRSKMSPQVRELDAEPKYVHQPVDKRTSSKTEYGSEDGRVASSLHYQSGQPVSSQSSRKSSSSELPPLPSSVPPPSWESGAQISPRESPAKDSGDRDALSGRPQLYQPEQPVHGSLQQRYSQPYNGSYGSQPVQTRQYTQPSGRAASSYDTLPPGVAPTYGSADIGSRSATLEVGTKPPIPSKPEKDKKAKHGFFSGIGFGKSKKDKEKDPKK